MAVKQTNFRLTPQTLAQLDAYEAHDNTTNRTQKLKDLMEDMRQLLIQGMIEFNQWFTPEEQNALLSVLSQTYEKGIPTTLTPSMIRHVLSQAKHPILEVAHVQCALNQLTALHAQLLTQWIRHAQREKDAMTLESLSYLGA